MTYAKQKVLITGASSGIGREFARQFHAEGASVLLVARRIEKLKALSEELNSLRGNSAEVLACDLTNPVEFSNLAATVAARDIDILVNNAGRGSFGYFDQQGLDAELQMVDLNVQSYMRLIHLIVPQMKKRGEGAIINVSSITGFQPLPFMATYSASKAFNLYHSLALRQELAAFGIKVVAVCPGPTATEFGDAARVPDAIRVGGKGSVEQVVAQSIRGLKRNAAIITPGILNSLLAMLAKHIPTNIGTYLMYRVLRKGA